MCVNQRNYVTCQCLYSDLSLSLSVGMKLFFETNKQMFFISIKTGLHSQTCSGIHFLDNWTICTWGIEKVGDSFSLHSKESGNMLSILFFITIGWTLAHKKSFLYCCSCLWRRPMDIHLGHHHRLPSQSAQWSTSCYTQNGSAVFVGK